MSRYGPTSGEVAAYQKSLGIHAPTGIVAIESLTKQNMLKALEGSAPNLQLQQDILIELLRLELKEY